MAEYNFVVLWSEDPNTKYPIETDELPLTPETKAMIHKWAERYNNSLNWDDPANTPPWDPADLRDFENEGIRIWLRLREELGPQFDVGYRSEILRRTLRDPSEL
jgi:hypothetical protein